MLEGFCIALGVICIAAGVICAVVAIFLALQSRRLAEEQRQRLDTVTRRLEELERRMAAQASQPAMPSTEAPPKPEAPARPVPPPIEVATTAPAAMPAPVVARAEAEGAPQPTTKIPYAEIFAQQPPPQPPPSQQQPPQQPLPSVTSGADRASEWWAAFEKRVGKRWMTWLGVLALILGALLFFQYAIKHGWVTPAMRVAMGIFFGVVLLALGEWFLRKTMRALGQGLVGGGLAILYASLYAGFALYHLFPQTVAFGGMVVVSVVGLVQALRHDALPISFLAVLGGFLTPVVLSTGKNDRDLLFTYVLVLDVSVLSIAFFRQWRALLSLAFTGTAALFVAWFVKFYSPDAMTPTLLWLGAFYATFLLMPFAHHFRSRTPLSIEQFIAAMASAVGTFALSYRILWPEHEHVLGFIALGMSAVYTGLCAFSRRRVPDDPASLFGFVVLAMTFLTLSVPLHFKLNGITLVWAIEAPALLLLGYRFRYRLARIGGFIVLALVVVRVFLYHWPLHERAFALFANRQFGVVMFVPLAAAVFAWVHRRRKAEAKLDDVVFRIASALAGGILATLFVAFEVRLWIALSSPAPEMVRAYWQFCCDTIIWSAGAAGFLSVGAALRSRIGRMTALPMLLVALVAAILAYVEDAPGGCLCFLNARFAVAAAVIVVLFAFAFVQRRLKEAGTAAVFILAGYLATLLADVEMLRWIGAQPQRHWAQSDYYRACAHALACLAGAAGFLAVALWAKSKPALRAGLAPLGMALIGAVIMYSVSPWNQALFLNPRFLLSLAAVAGVFSYARVERREQGNGATILGIAGGFFLIILADVELRRWLNLTGGTPEQLDYRALALDVLLWTLGAIGFFAAGHRLKNSAARVAGFVPLAIGAAEALWGYMQPGFLPAHLCLNARFLASLFAAVTGLGYGFILRRLGRRVQGRALYIAGIPFLLVVLSVEDFMYWLHRSGLDPERAAWTAQMSLSVIWSVYAIALLGIGFWNRRRAMRFGGLALFGLTALKLAIVDMTHEREIYRIVSYVVLGALMIGASYLYHRIEKRLQPAERPPNGPVSGPPA